MKSILVVLGMVLLLISIFTFVVFDEVTEEYEESQGEYQGPVPLGYDVEYFRKTGETIKEVTENGS